MPGVGVGVFRAAGAPAHVAALVPKQGHGRGQRLHVAAMPVDEDEARRPARRGAAELHQQQTQGGCADRDGATELLVLAAGAVSDRPERRAISIHLRSRAGRRGRGRRRPRYGYRCPAAGEAHAVRWNRRGRSMLMMCSAAAATLRSRARFHKAPADGRPNSPGVRQLLAHAQQLISRNLRDATIDSIHVSPLSPACTRNFARRPRAPVRRSDCRGTPSARANPSGTSTSSAQRSWTDA